MSRESDETGQALSVLSDIWHAREQTSEDLEGLFGHTKSCKAMANIGFHGGTNAPVDEDLRTAWRDKLAREGKLHPDGESLRDMLFDQPER
jgi:hypothetical protein